MQGYIIKITPQKNEDILLYILTHSKIKKLYRFYGARHSTIQLGKKIDFEVEQNGLFIPKIRNITALNFIWERDLERLQAWQRYLQILYKHFQGIENIDSFYLDMLDNGAIKLALQNPYRVILEMYASLLHFEGRTPSFTHCFLCSQELQGQISLARSFLIAHQKCLGSNISFFIDDIKEYLINQSTVKLNDKLTLNLWQILLQGI
ncbi:MULTISPECIES: recombination protein RecO [unclassified Helicobacter]|uniref:recombination protein RecO n=1 Tax=unclassified Helicobacter TaxID=2593540 RepID=UPI000CF0C512|nr:MULTISPECIES: recombination protein RecO [unclassified Helicobacter]